MKRLVSRFGRTAVLFLIGTILIMYAAFGIIYFQQQAKGRELEGQISKTTLVLSGALPSDEQLRAEYDAVNLSLSPMTTEAILSVLVGLAEDNGINIEPDSSKLKIPPPRSDERKLGTETYAVLSFRNIVVEGEYENVMGFISAIDSGDDLITAVVNRVDITQSRFIDEEVKVTTTKVSVT